MMIPISMSNIVLLFFWACQRQEEPTSYQLEIVGDERTLSSEQIEQGISVGIAYWEQLVPSELYRLYLEKMENIDLNCPQIFPAVQQSQGWNNNCETSQGWQFSGRSQFRYEQNIAFEGQDYQDVGYFISNLLIESPEGESLLMQGFGDLRISEQERWFELVGTFASSEIDWLSDQVAMQLQKSVGLDGIVQISGGISAWGEFPEGVMGFIFESLELRASNGCQILGGSLVISGTLGEREVWTLEAQDSCEICRESGACWDLEHLVGDQQW